MISKGMLGRNDQKLRVLDTSHCIYLRNPQILVLQATLIILGISFINEEESLRTYSNIIGVAHKHK